MKINDKIKLQSWLKNKRKVEGKLLPIFIIAICSISILYFPYRDPLQPNEKQRTWPKHKIKPSNTIGKQLLTADQYEKQ